MPGRLAYDEAMLLAPVRLKVTDPALKYGHVAMVKTATARGIIERPWGMEGSFAIVYKFTTSEGTPRALRCFKTILPHIHTRYEQIAMYIRSHAQNIMTSFAYHPEGLLVREQEHSKVQVYPIMDMEWIEGQTLLEHVYTLTVQGNRQALKQLADQWLDLFITLRNNNIAHGDLSGINVMVRPDGQLALVDYDNMYVPTLKNMSRVLLGHPDYQHPSISLNNLSPYMDDFAALVIYTVLYALSLYPDLWQHHAKQDSQGKRFDTNMLFTQQDLQHPDQSKLIQAMKKIADPHLNTLIQHLRLACQQPTDAVRFPLSLLQRPYLLTQPIATISKEPTIETNNTPLTDPEIESVEIPINTSKPTTQKSIITNATSEDIDLFLQACQQDDDEAIAQAYEALHNFSHLSTQYLSKIQQQRAQLALQRRSALAHFRMALANRRPLQIASAYNAALLDHCHNLSTEERNCLALASTYRQAWESQSAAALVSAYEKIKHSSYHSTFIFSQPERQRLQFAYLTMHNRTQKPHPQPQNQLQKEPQ